MTAFLRHSSIALAFAASLALVGCSGGTDTDASTDGGTDVVRDVSNMDVQRDDVMGTDGGTDGGGGTCSTGMLGSCNPVTNAGCPTGQACYIVGDGDGGVTASCSTPGTAGAEMPCANADSCLQGFACLGDPGRCVKLCCAPGDNDTCRNGPGGIRGATCSVGIQNVPVFGCQATTNCDWFAQDCANGNNCEPTDATGTTTCTSPGGTGMDGAPCGSASGAVDCALGYACIQLNNDAGTGPACRKVCDPTATGTDAGTTDGGVSRTCDAPLHCGGVNNRPNNYGVCVP